MEKGFQKLLSAVGHGAALATRRAALWDRKRHVCAANVETLIQSRMPLTWGKKHMWVTRALSEPTLRFHKTLCAFGKRLKPPQASEVECRLTGSCFEFHCFETFSNPVSLLNVQYKKAFWKTSHDDHPGMNTMSTIWFAVANPHREIEMKKRSDKHVTEFKENVYYEEKIS